jgi:hypothetical protein
LLVKPSQQVVARHTTALDDAAKLIERFDLDLAHAFARQLQIRGDLLKRADFSTAQTITTFENPALLLRQLFDPATDQLADFIGLQQTFRVERILIGNGVSDGVIGVDLKRRIERGDVLVERQRPAYLVDRTVDKMRNLFNVNLLAVGHFHLPERAQNQIDFLDHMHRKTDGT